MPTLRGPRLNTLPSPIAEESKFSFSSLWKELTMNGWGVGKSRKKRKMPRGKGVYNIAKRHPITMETRKWGGRGTNFMVGLGCTECGCLAGLWNGDVQQSVILQSKILHVTMAQRRTGQEDCPVNWTWRTREGRVEITVLRMDMNLEGSPVAISLSWSPVYA